MQKRKEKKSPKMEDLQDQFCLLPILLLCPEHLFFFLSQAKYIFRLSERQNKCSIRINFPRVMTLKSLFDLQGLVN